MASRALDRYPIIMNGTTLPFFPTTWQRAPKKIQTTNQSEGGRDIVQVARSNKMTINATFALADAAWVAFFENLKELDSFVLKAYSPRLDDYEERTVRIEDYNDAPRRKSEKLEGVTGVWDVSFTIEEF
jgi:hypothetical protein